MRMLWRKRKSPRLTVEKNNSLNSVVARATEFYREARFTNNEFQNPRTCVRQRRSLRERRTKPNSVLELIICESLLVRGSKHINDRAEVTAPCSDSLRSSIDCAHRTGAVGFRAHLILLAKTQGYDLFGAHVYNCISARLSH